MFGTKTLTIDTGRSSILLRDLMIELSDKIYGTMRSRTGTTMTAALASWNGSSRTLTKRALPTLIGFLSR